MNRDDKPESPKCACGQQNNRRCPIHPGEQQYIMTIGAGAKSESADGGGFDVATVSRDAIEQMKLGVAIDSAYIHGARWQFNQIREKVAIWECRANLMGERAHKMSDELERLRTENEKFRGALLTIGHSYLGKDEELREYARKALAAICPKK